jgi:hypothetical protein
MTILDTSYDIRETLALKRWHDSQYIVTFVCDTFGEPCELQNACIKFVSLAEWRSSLSPVAS